MSTTAKIAGSLILLATVFSVSSCGADVASDNAGNRYGGKDSPYAPRIQEILDYTDSQAVRDILEDFVITDEEYYNAKREFSECMENAGWKAVFDDEGYSNQANSPTAGTINDSGESAKCNHAFDPIAGLYRAVQTNPDNQDNDKLMTECMKEKGLAPDDYTVTDYARESTGWEKSGIVAKMFADTGEERRKFGECQSSPLGIKPQN